MVNARSDPATGLWPREPGAPVQWLISGGVEYDAAVAFMEQRARAIAEGTAPELVWLIEHPPLYTAGTSARPSELLSPRFPVFASGRGGQFTYHGPGQRVAYLMLDLRRRQPDVRRYVASLEQWLIDTLAAFNLRGERRCDRIGVWVARPDKGPEREDKIAAIGVRLKRWVSLHGVSLNVDCDLSHFAGIVPCGISTPQYGVTSLVDLGLPVTMEDVDLALKRAFVPLFGPIEAISSFAAEGFGGVLQAAVQR